MKNEDKLILDLCGGTGSWSEPYLKAGYKVLNVTLPEYDVRHWRRYPEIAGPVLAGNVHGILAAPPCTMFSFARTSAKTPRNIVEGMECVRACLEIIWIVQERQQDTSKKHTTLAWWALENPYHGLLLKIIGRPAFTFDPYEFGDGYKKRTALWGNFHDPIKLRQFVEEPRSSWASKKFDRLKSNEIHAEYFGMYDRKTRRAITPKKFALAFFKVNP